jgi:hypothetical protein
MTEDLFCSIYVDAALDHAALAALVAELTAGRVEGRAVVAPWARIGLDDDYGDADVRARNPDSHLGWRVLLEVMPSTGDRAEVVRRVGALITGLVGRGLRARAQADYADELPATAR